MRGQRPSTFRPRQETVPDWSDMTAPTPAQWLAHLDGQPDAACREWLVSGLLDAADDGARCVQADHESYPRQLDAARAALVREIGRSRRYRLAWLRARRYRAWVMRIRAGGSLTNVTGPRHDPPGRR